MPYSNDTERHVVRKSRWACTLHAALFFGGFMKHKMKQNTIQDLPHVNVGECAGCGTCAKVCFRKAISYTEKDKADIFQKRCVGIESCGRCIDICANNAIEARR
jgi:MinD superfamily P-loop ATPase